MCTQTPSMITGQHCAESPNAESSARQNTSCAKQMHTNPNMHAQLTPALPKYAQHSHNISYMIQGRRAPAPPQVMVWSRAHVTPLSGNGLVPGPLAPLVMVWSQGRLPRPPQVGLALVLPVELTKPLHGWREQAALGPYYSPT